MSDDDALSLSSKDLAESDAEGVGAEHVGESKPLPDGVRKEVITEASSAEHTKPKFGDEVTVHYVGTLETSGQQFDSSREKLNACKFTLGKGVVVKGFDLGVTTMKRGEIAKFTLQPEFAYGIDGLADTVPPGVPVVFEIELIDWSSQDDVFGDEGVMMTVVKDGSTTCWKKPKVGDEVLMTLRVDAADGSHIEDRNYFEYTLGSGALGCITKACDQSLQKMRKGGEVSLKCSKDYAYGDESPNGVVISLSLQEIYEIKDVSFRKDKSVIKKRIREGTGYEQPKDCAKVVLSVEAATNGGVAIAGFVAKVLVFKLGDGEVCDALEFAVSDMKKGERAVLTVKNIAAVTEPQLGLGAGVAEEMIVLTLQLDNFFLHKEVYSMSQDEKVDFFTSRKNVGSELFKKERLELALQRYTKVIENFEYINDLNEGNKAKAKAMIIACELNKAACFLKLNDYDKAKASCAAVLKDDKQNVKALYRRAQSEFGLKNFSACVGDCKGAAKLDPQNREVRELLKKAQDGQKEADKQAAGLFASMCSALGSGESLRRPEEDEEGAVTEAAVQLVERQMHELREEMALLREGSADDDICAAAERKLNELQKEGPATFGRGADP